MRLYGSGSRSLSAITAGTLSPPLNLSASNTVTAANRQLVGTGAGVFLNTPSGTEATVGINNTVGLKVGASATPGTGGTWLLNPNTLYQSFTLVSAANVNDSNYGPTLLLFGKEHTGHPLGTLVQNKCISIVPKASTGAVAGGFQWWSNAVDGTTGIRQMDLTDSVLTLFKQTAAGGYAGAFGGSFTPASLTAARTYTLPDTTGTMLVSTSTVVPSFSDTATVTPGQFRPSSDIAFNTNTSATAGTNGIGKTGSTTWVNAPTGSTVALLNQGTTVLAAGASSVSTNQPLVFASNGTGTAGNWEIYRDASGLNINVASGNILFKWNNASASWTFSVNTFTLGNNQNISFGTSGGTKIASSNLQKMGFWGATPIAQPTTAFTAATFVAGAGTAVNDASTFDGYTLKQIVAAMRSMGLLA